MTRSILRTILIVFLLGSLPLLAGGEEDLLEAAAGGKEQKVQRLLARGADAGATDGEGNSALHLAIAGGHPDVVILLLKEGADANARDARGRTPMHLAASRGSLEMMQLLMKGGGNLRARDGEGETPLDLASKQEALRPLVAWHDTRAAGTHAAHEEYLAAYPDSPWAGEARERAAYLLDHECTSRTMVVPETDGRTLEYLTPSGKPCGRRVSRERFAEQQGRRVSLPAEARTSPEPVRPVAQQRRPGVGVTQPSEGGVMVIEQAQYDVGEVTRGEPLEHTFLIKNTGTGPLTIQAKPG